MPQTVDLQGDSYSYQVQNWDSKDVHGCTDIKQEVNSAELRIYIYKITG